MCCYTLFFFLHVVMCFQPDESLAESTPVRDRMALYKAAISKQDVPPSAVSVSTPVNHSNDFCTGSNAVRLSNSG